MQVTEHALGPVTRLDVRGNLVVSVGERDLDPLRAAFARLVETGRTRVAVNLAEVPTIDARGLGEIVRGFNLLKAGGGGVVLMTVTDKVRRLLRLTRLDTVVPLADSEEAAVETLGGRASSRPRLFRALFRRVGRGRVSRYVAPLRAGARWGSSRGKPSVSTRGKD